MSCFYAQGHSPAASAGELIPRHIGCSASRGGLSDAQKMLACRVLIDSLFEASRKKGSITFHHGDCINGDAFLHDAAHELGFSIVIHPPENGALRAYKRAPVILPVKPYLERNREMVDACEVMVICPDTEAYRIKSGAWYTWKYAKLQKKRVILITPSGVIS